MRVSSAPARAYVSRRDWLDEHLEQFLIETEDEDQYYQEVLGSGVRQFDRTWCAYCIVEYISAPRSERRDKRQVFGMELVGKLFLQGIHFIVKKACHMTRL